MGKKNNTCVFLSQKKALLHEFKMFPSFTRPIHHFHACVPISCQKNLIHMSLNEQHELFIVFWSETISSDSIIKISLPGFNFWLCWGKHISTLSDQCCVCCSGHNYMLILSYKQLQKNKQQQWGQQQNSWAPHVLVSFSTFWNPTSDCSHSTWSPQMQISGRQWKTQRKQFQ